MSHSRLFRTSTEIALLIAAARARSTRQWVPGRSADPTAIQRAREDFDSSLISPVADSVEVDQPIAEVLNVEPGTRAVWFITKHATQRVFVDDSSGLFGVAWGPDAATGKYSDLGIRSDDPIDAFLA
jgi:hypothetical protein